MTVVSSGYYDALIWQANVYTVFKIFKTIFVCFYFCNIAKYSTIVIGALHKRSLIISKILISIIFIHKLFGYCT